RPRSPSTLRCCKMARTPLSPSKACLNDTRDAGFTCVPWPRNKKKSSGIRCSCYYIFENGLCGRNSISLRFTSSNPTTLLGQIKRFGKLDGRILHRHSLGTILRCGINRYTLCVLIAVALRKLPGPHQRHRGDHI